METESLSILIECELESIEGCSMKWTMQMSTSARRWSPQHRDPHAHRDRESMRSRILHRSIVVHHRKRLTLGMEDQQQRHCRHLLSLPSSSCLLVEQRQQHQQQEQRHEEELLPCCVDHECPPLATPVQTHAEESHNDVRVVWHLWNSVARMNDRVPRDRERSDIHSREITRNRAYLAQASQSDRPRSTAAE